MALLNKLDREHVEDRLAGWLAQKLLEARDVAIADVVIPESSGMSMTTVLFKAAYTERGERRTLDLVARAAPDAESRVFKDLDLEREFRVVKTLSDETDLPVPAPHWIEHDPGWLGAEFVVSDRVYGKTLEDDPPWTAEGWVLGLAPDQRERLMRNGLEVLAGLHFLDWRQLGLDFLDRSDFGPLGTDQQIELWYDAYEWSAAGGASPTIDAAFEWVRENRPADREDVVFNWGDARPGNFMFGDDQSVQAALDWELATLASPEMDLAWWLVLQRHHSEGVGVALPEGVPDAAQTIAIYEDLSGRSVENMEFHEAFASLRSAIIMMRMGSLLIAGGALPEGHPMPYDNPSSRLLAKLLDLPFPGKATGGSLSEAGGFLGDRRAGR